MRNKKTNCNLSGWSRRRFIQSFDNFKLIQILRQMKLCKKISFASNAIKIFHLYKTLTFYLLILCHHFSRNLRTISLFDISYQTNMGKSTNCCLSISFLSFSSESLFMSLISCYVYMYSDDDTCGLIR